jgi:hypothetical protein
MGGGGLTEFLSNVCELHQLFGILSLVPLTICRFVSDVCC